MKWSHLTVAGLMWIIFSVAEIIATTHFSDYTMLSVLPYTPEVDFFLPISGGSRLRAGSSKLRIL